MKKACHMRTNVVIDDNLMKEAMEKSGLKTKKAAIEEGLKMLAQFRGREEIRRYRGKLKWSGHLEKMRTDK
jgi:Arc/MetJ family transcription regulator